MIVYLIFTGCTSLRNHIKVVKDTPDEFIYEDYYRRRIRHKIFQDVEKRQYDRNLFKLENERMIYLGDDYTTRFGVDVSRHDGLIDWEKVRESDVEFVIFRIGWRGYQTGILHVDEIFHKNIKGAIENKFDIGVYVYSQAICEEEALEEAELVLNELKGYKIQLPVVYDPESVIWEKARTDGLSGEQITKNTIAFCNRIKEAGYEPMIYSNLIWETKYFNLSELKEYKIWYADYGEKPLTPYHFEFWQFGGEYGTVPGIGRKVDVDIQLIKK